MKNFILVIVFGLLTFSLSAKEYYGTDANKIIKGAIQVRIAEKASFPDFIVFSEINQIPVEKFNSWIKSYLTNPEKINFKLISKTADKVGYTHYKYQQLYNNMVIVDAAFTLHTKNNKIVSFNGNLFTKVDVSNQVIFSSNKVINIAKAYMHAEKYKWEIVAEENQLKLQTGNSQATYYPLPELKIFNTKKGDFKEVYDLTLYAQKPIDKKQFFIDVTSGEILNIRQRLYPADVTGTAVTHYSGTQTIITDSYSGSYRLREAGRGNGIETYNMGTGTNYGSATDFTDADNNWNNVNAQQDEIATDAHWGAEMTYDYYNIIHGRNSIDNNGFKLISYVHYDVGYNNAFWDGAEMTYGDGSGSYNPFTALDICGHEITHGLDENTAGLIYQDESGALNEGFSDVFGVAIEFYGKPSQANWTMGEDIGTTLRSLSNPNAYGDPDTYQGTNWYTGTADNGGVHTNSTVLGHWFYLASIGGSGTNDIGNAYTVNGIGINDASAVAFRMLTVYLTASSNYNDARYYAIVSAIDLFGACTPQVEAVTNAMYAVGLGTPYSATVTSDFTAAITSACQTPFAATFQNLSNNASNFIWYFGDGATSTLVNPTHTYTSYGNYNVKLVADGGSCGKDSVLKNSFISVSTSNPCIVILPLDGVASTQTTCTGKLFDGGGATGNYADNSNATVTISPSGATDITLTFLSFDVEPGSGATCDYDYLEIFDGPNTSSTSLGIFCNTNGSPGTITTSGGSVTITLHSDQGLNLAGFEMDWACSMANVPPIANFSNTAISTCTGDVNFTDLSSNGPTSWLWNFGDGQTSTMQNPTHTYATNGVYNVTLTATNTYGSDVLTNNNLVTVNRPLTPIVTNDTICENNTALLNASANGVINWYTQPTGGILLYTGGSYTTSILPATTSFYVENAVIAPSQYVGNNQSSTNGGNFTATNEHYLIFDCLSPFTLVSVEVNATTAGNRIIQLRDASGTVLQTITANIPVGISRVTLNFSVPVGTNLRLVGPGSPNLWRSNGGVSFPYSLPGLVSINNSDAGTAYYYYFYDWEVKESDCVSPRIPVTAVVNPIVTPIINIATSPTTICLGDLVMFTSNITNGGSSPNYQWLINGSDIGVNYPAITTYTIANNDVVNCILTSSEACVTNSNASSNSITMTVNNYPTAGFTYTQNYLDYSFTSTSADATSYLWYFGDGNSSTVQNPLHTYTLDGTYTVSLIVSNSCGSDTILQNVIITNINSLINNIGINIYPNPFNENVIVEYYNNINNIYMSDILGNKLNLKTEKFSSNKILFNTKILSKGVYFINVTTLENNFTYKIIKE